MDITTGNARRDIGLIMGVPIGPNHLRRWTATGVVVFLIVLALLLLFAPQSYMSKMSLLVATPSESMGVLSGLGIGASPSSKITGLLKSRRLAERVERSVHLQKLYKLDTEEDAVDMLLAGLSISDNAREGLVYVSVTLKAPAYLIGRNGGFREQVKKTAADALDRYAQELKTYVASSDFDRDSILLKAAKDKLTSVREAYDKAVRNMLELVDDSKTEAPDAPAGAFRPPSSDVTSSAGAALPGGMDELYKARAQLEIDIQGAEASLRLGDELRGDQLNNLSGMPSEDPLLTKARDIRSIALRTYEGLRNVLAAEHPKVVLAKLEFDLADRVLQNQVKSLRAGKTTSQVEAKVGLTALREKLKRVTSQIEEAEERSRVFRGFQAEYQKRFNDVAIQLEVLKQAASQEAVLSFQMVSGTKRLSVVDNAIKDRFASPGLTLLSLGSLLAALLVVLVRAMIELRVAGFRIDAARAGDSPAA